MKFTCPHCGERTFSPLKKALCGGMTAMGKNCPNCGGRCVNGKASLAVHTILTFAAFVMIIITYLFHDDTMDIVYFGLIPLVAAWVIGFLFDMCVGKLIKAIRHE